MKKINPLFLLILICICILMSSCSSTNNQIQSSQTSEDAPWFTCDEAGNIYLDVWSDFPLPPSSTKRLIIPATFNDIKIVRVGHSEIRRGGGLGSMPHVEEVVICEGIEYIQRHAFRRCTSLMTAYIPKTVKEIGQNPFYECENFSTIYYQGSEDEWNSIEKGENTFDNINIIFNSNIE